MVCQLILTMRKIKKEKRIKMWGEAREATVLNKMIHGSEI